MMMMMMMKVVLFVALSMPLCCRALVVCEENGVTQCQCPGHSIDEYEECCDYTGCCQASMIDTPACDGWEFPPTAVPTPAPTVTPLPTPAIDTMLVSITGQATSGLEQIAFNSNHALVAVGNKLHVADYDWSWAATSVLDVGVEISFSEQVPEKIVDIALANDKAYVIGCRGAPEACQMHDFLFDGTSWNWRRWNFLSGNTASPSFGKLQAESYGVALLDTDVVSGDQRPQVRWFPAPTFEHFTSAYDAVLENNVLHHYPINGFVFDAATLYISCEESAVVKKFIRNNQTGFWEAQPPSENIASLWDFEEGWDSNADSFGTAMALTPDSLLVASNPSDLLRVEKFNRESGTPEHQVEVSSAEESELVAGFNEIGEPIVATSFDSPTQLGFLWTESASSVTLPEAPVSDAYTFGHRVLVTFPDENSILAVKFF